MMNTRLLEEVKAGQRVLLVGPPGCGKTARLKAIAQQLDMDFDHVPLHHTERVDWGGGFVPDRVNGVMRQLPLERLNRWMQYKQGGRRLLALIDDLGKAPVDVQGALKSVVTRGNGGLPNSVVVCGATNRPSDKAGVNSLDESLRTEFDATYRIAVPGESERQRSIQGTQFLTDGTVYLQPYACPTAACGECELCGWIEWAMEHGAPAEIIAYHRSTLGKSLYTWKPNSDPAVRMADFRTWGSSIVRWNAGLRSLESMSACLGHPEAATFLAFASLANELPSPDQIWLDPMGSRVPENPSAQWLITTILGERVQESVVTQFMAYIARFPRTMTALAARNCYRRLGAKLSGNKAWVRWFMENKELFEV